MENKKLNIKELSNEQTLKKISFMFMCSVFYVIYQYGNHSMATWVVAFNSFGYLWLAWAFKDRETPRSRGGKKLEDNKILNKVVDLSIKFENDFDKFRENKRGKQNEN